jgi:hypothetical protein
VMCWARPQALSPQVQGTEIWLVSDLYIYAIKLSIFLSFLSQSLMKDVLVCDFTVYCVPKIDREPNCHLLTVLMTDSLVIESDFRRLRPDLVLSKCYAGSYNTSYICVIGPTKIYKALQGQPVI